MFESSKAGYHMADIPWMYAHTCVSSLVSTVPPDMVFVDPYGLGL
jgi:hypothetical protein